MIVLLIHVIECHNEIHEHIASYLVISCMEIASLRRARRMQKQPKVEKKARVWDSALIFDRTQNNKIGTGGGLFRKQNSAKATRKPAEMGFAEFENPYTEIQSIFSIV